jgi:hypothetical protein
MLQGATANRLIGGDSLDDGSLGGGRGVRRRGAITICGLAGFIVLR